MEEIITYSLYKDNNDSKIYYNNIDAFANEVLSKIYDNTYEEIKDYRKFLATNKIEDLREELEYLLEILVIGVFWRCYISNAVMLRTIPREVLIRLSKIREKERLKKESDILRGILETLYLKKEEYNEIEISFENFMLLVNWMKATGEFKEEVKRLENWIYYFSYKSTLEVKNIINKASELAGWFEFYSEDKLGFYTRNVEKFHKENYETHKWKEDYIYCGRKRVEYHLNMVGAEILNRVYKNEFLRTKEKRLLLPGCMKFYDEKNCKAIKSSDGYLCSNCNKKCRVNKCRQLGEKYNFKTYIIPHESTISVNTVNSSIGIIGVTCVLNLIAGGWKAKNLGFVPQCVLLDYCGCKNHWHKEGIVTDLNLDRLLYLLKEDKF